MHTLEEAIPMKKLAITLIAVISSPLALADDPCAGAPNVAACRVQMRNSGVTNNLVEQTHSYQPGAGAEMLYQREEDQRRAQEEAERPAREAAARAAQKEAIEMDQAERRTRALERSAVANEKAAKAASSAQIPRTLTCTTVGYQVQCQ